jgi:hypothetical protein
MERTYGFMAEASTWAKTNTSAGPQCADSHKSESRLIYGMARRSNGLPPGEEFKNLADLRHSLLRLHKMLLDIERGAYQAQHGAQTSVQMLQLVIENQQFAWLRMISELIVRIDEFLEGEELPTPAAAEALIQETRDLLKPSPTGNAFQSKYDAALQADVDVIFAHREVQEILARPAKPVK